MKNLTLNSQMKTSTVRKSCDDQMQGNGMNLKRIFRNIVLSTFCCLVSCHINVELNRKQIQNENFTFDLGNMSFLTTLVINT